MKTPMEELKERLNAPVEDGVVKQGVPLHERPKCKHGRPTLCWECDKSK